MEKYNTIYGGKVYDPILNFMILISNVTLAYFFFFLFTLPRPIFELSIFRIYVKHLLNKGIPVPEIKKKKTAKAVYILIQILSFSTFYFAAMYLHAETFSLITKYLLSL